MTKAAAKRREQYLNSLQRELWQNAKRRADRLGLPFTILPEDIIIHNYCPVLGLELNPSTGHSSDASPSVDRFVPELGYVPGNITVISHRANTLKGTGTAEEHLKIAKWLKAHKSRGEP